MTSEQPPRDSLAEIRAILFGSLLDDQRWLLDELRARQEAEAQRGSAAAAALGEHVQRIERGLETTGEQARRALNELEARHQELERRQVELEQRLAELETRSVARDEARQVLNEIARRLGGDA